MPLFHRMGSSYTALGYFDICRLGATQILRPVLRLAPIYSSAIPDCKNEGTLRKRCRHRPVQYLNNILEQDHRAIKRRMNAKQGFREFQAARRTIQGYEAVHMIRKGQVRWVAGDDLLRQIQFIDSLFDLAA